MAKPTALEMELRKATGVKPKGGEDRQDYLKRLSDKAQDIPEEAWEDLSEPAQLWANAAVAAGTNGKDIKDFVEEGGEEEEEEEAGAEVPASDKRHPGRKKPTAVKAAKKPAKATPAPKKAAATKKPAPTAKKGKGGDEPKEDGVKVVIKRMVLADPKVPVDDVMDELAKRGGTPSRMTVSGIRAEFRHSLKFLKSVGALKVSVDI